MTALFPTVAQAIAQDELCAVVTALRGPAVGRKIFVRADGASCGSLGDAAVNAAAVEQAQAAMQARSSARIDLPVGDTSWDLLLDVHTPQEVLVIVGAVHIAIPLVRFAKELGLRTVVVDARTAFATPARFAHADELILRWPADVLAEMALNESAYVVTLTHDEKLDTPALIAALARPVAYVGALGSRRTHAKRVAALEEAGVSPGQIERIHAPIGLDLGGRSPEEIALSIIAEIVQVRNRGGRK